MNLKRISNIFRGDQKHQHAIENKHKIEKREHRRQSVNGGSRPKSTTIGN